MLGVDPDASHDEVRRAYTARALRLHPDRQVGATPDEVERAEWKMKELNAAWEELRDPARRRSYDRREGVGAHGSTTTRPRPATGAGVARPGFADDLPEPEPDPTGGHDGVPVAPDRLAGVVRYAPVVVILVVLVAILVLSAVAAPDTEDDPDVVTTEAVPVGSCVQLRAVASGEPGEPARIPLVVEVDCAEPNAARVVDKVPFPTPCPPETVNVPVPAEGISLCLQRPR